MSLRRYLATRGRMGACPDWYAHVQAAKYLGVAPWELATHSLYWKDCALKSMDVEAEAQAILNQQQQH